MARMWCCAWCRAFGGRLGYPGPLMYNDIASGQPYLFTAQPEGYIVAFTLATVNFSPLHKTVFSIPPFDRQCFT